MKKCTKCRKRLALSRFDRDRSRSDGHRSHCKKCRRKRHASSRHAPVVYFIKNVQGTGHIKVGISRNLSVRVAELSRKWGVRMQLLRSMPGGEALEFALHERLKPWRVAGEWYRPCPLLLEILEGPDLKVELVNAGD